MYRYEGDSTVFSYGNEGGISLFSTEPPDGAISGGSGNEGSQTQATRLRWWIIQNPDGFYDGGITGEGWFREVSYEGEPIETPFALYSDAQIYGFAEDGNLDEVFGPWNANHSGETDPTIQIFVMHLKMHGAGGCVIEGGIGS